MRNYVLVLIMVFLVMLYAWTLDRAHADPAFGATAGTGSNYGVTIGDYNLFDQSRTIMGIKRYGGGTSYMQVGNGVGLHMEAEGGVLLNDGFFKVTAELGAGRIMLNSNRGAETSYQWLPMAGFGPQFDLGGYKLLGVARAGGSAGNFGNEGLAPHLHDAYGCGIFFDKYFALSYTYIGDARLRSVEVENQDFIARFESNRGVRDEQIGLLMWRRGL